MKSHHNGSSTEGRICGGGLWLQTQEDQDLCAVATAEQPILKTSSEHRTVDLGNKCITKDFLSGFVMSSSEWRISGPHV